MGPEASRHAWLLVQHADLDPAFQEETLKKMKALPPSEVNQTDLAYLDDRVAVKADRPQLYGTQFHCRDGKPQPQGVETMDLAAVERRRNELGLAPLVEYEKKFAANCAATAQ